MFVFEQFFARELISKLRIVTASCEVCCLFVLEFLFLMESTDNRVMEN